MDTILPLFINMSTVFLGIFAWTQLFKPYSVLRRMVYGLSANVIVSVSIACFVSYFFGSYFSATIIFGLTSIIGLLVDRLSPKDNINISSKQFESIIPILICTIFILSYGINIINYSRGGFSVPVVGSNDDTSTHVAMSIMTIKESQLLFRNPLLKSLVKTGIPYENAFYYPPTVYTYTALLYDSLLGSKSKIDINLLFNIYASLSFVMFAMLIFSIFDTAFRLVRSINIWSIPVLLVFGVFFIGGEYFMILIRMSYLTQILGSVFMLMSIGFAIDFISSNKSTENIRVPPYFQLLIGIFVLGVGLTYYLFLPIAYTALWILAYPLVKKLGFSMALIKENFLVIFLAVLSLIPFILYVNSYSLVQQVTIPGVNIITLGSLLQFCMMILVFITLRKYTAKSASQFLLIILIATFLLALLTTVPTLLKNKELPYYFFKSFFTSSLIAVIMFIASISIIVSHTNSWLHSKSNYRSFVTMLTLFVFLPIIFVIYLYKYETLTIGYKGITHLASGGFNYYDRDSLQKLISLYKRYGDKGIAVYNMGYWGENILLFALFENIPKIHVTATENEIFYFAKNPTFFIRDIAIQSKKSKEIYMFDGHGVFKKAPTAGKRKEM